MFPFLLLLMLLFSISPSLPLLLYSLFVILLTLGLFACLFICIRSLALGGRGITSLEATAGGGDVGSGDCWHCCAGWVSNEFAMVGDGEMGNRVTWHGHSFPKCRGQPLGMFKWDGRSGSWQMAETGSWEHVSASRGDGLGQQQAN